MEKKTTADRLAELMQADNLRQVDIVERCRPLCERYGLKMNRSDISQYLSGRAEPKQNKIYIMAKALNVSEGWLMGFDVPKERRPEPEAPRVLSLDGLTDSEIKELEMYKEFLIARRGR